MNNRTPLDMPRTAPGKRTRRRTNHAAARRANGHASINGQPFVCEGNGAAILAEIAAAAESAGLSVREIEQTMTSAQRRATA